MDWVQFAEDNNIDYVSRGPNTKKGEISIRCPWCGDDDPSHHLGISLTTENWGCHRDARHRGHAAHTLIAALLGCSFSQARLTAAQFSRADPDDLDSALIALNAPSEAPKPSNGPMALPRELRQITYTGSTARFWHYLQRRGFDNVRALIDQYRLSCCLTGRWKDRIIIPFYRKESVIGWTARAIIKPVNAPRYLSTDAAIKTTIFNETDLMAGGDLLFIVEGPFDALKLDYYGQRNEARATCIFGTSFSMDQLSLLSILRRRFKKLVIMLDPEAVGPAFEAEAWLSAPNVEIGRIPFKDVEDPGALNAAQVLSLVKMYG